MLRNIAENSSSEASENDRGSFKFNFKKQEEDDDDCDSDARSFELITNPVDRLMASIDNRDDAQALSIIKTLKSPLNNTVLDEIIRISDNKEILEAITKDLPEDYLLDLINKITFLHAAAAYGNISAIHFFMKKNHDLDSRDSRGNTPFEIALANGEFDAATALFDYGSIMDYNKIISEFYHQAQNYRDSNGNNLLHLAASVGDLNFAYFLLSQGIASPYRTNNIVESPLHIAISKGYESFATYFANYIKRAPEIINIKNIYGETALMQALKFGIFDFAVFLMNDPRTNRGNFSNLHYCAATNDFSGYEYCLREDFDIYIPDNNGFLPIHYAAMVGSLGICRDILNIDEKDGRNMLNICSKDGISPFALAFFSHNTEVIKLFLDRFDRMDKLAMTNGLEYIAPENIDIINTRDAYGSTPIMHAAAMGDFDLVRRLYRRGADPLLTSNEGYSAIDCAGEYKVIADYLRNKIEETLENTRIVEHKIKPSSPKTISAALLDEESKGLEVF